MSKQQTKPKSSYLTPGKNYKDAVVSDNEKKELKSSSKVTSKTINAAQLVDFIKVLQDTLASGLSALISGQATSDMVNESDKEIIVDKEKEKRVSPKVSQKTKNIQDDVSSSSSKDERRVERQSSSKSQLKKRMKKQVRISRRRKIKKKKIKQRNLQRNK